MYYLQIFALLLTLAVIYVCLKYPKLPCRLGILLVGIAVDAAAYFIADYSTAVYLGAMILLATPFVIGKKKKEEDA